MSLDVADHRLVVHFREGLGEALTVGGALLGQLVAKGQHVGVLVAFRREVPGLLLDQVHHTLEACLDAYRHLYGYRPRAQALLHHLDGVPEVRADAVHLVNEADPRHAVAVRLPPDRLRLGLDAGDGVEDDHAAVEDAQAALHLDGEVHVARRVDDVDLMVEPFAGGSGGGYGDAALALLGHPVHYRRALVHLAHLVGAAGVKEDALSDRSLAGVNMGNDAYVA